MTTRRESLLRMLADGREHSGEDLAEKLEVSRTAIWKHIQALCDWGLEVQSVPRRGYRLEQAIDLLDVDRLRGELDGDAGGRIVSLRVELDVESTNSELLTAGPPPEGCMAVCLAEFQRSGRGRRGRRWVAPLGSGLCLSMSWHFREIPAQISSLALVIGVAATRALDRCGVADVNLKWPNDLLVRGRKLGGILIEMRAEAGGPAFVVIGIGINVRLSAKTRAALEHEGALPADLCPDGALLPDRSRLAAAVIIECLAAIREFETCGFAPFIADWRRRDALSGHPVTVSHVSGDVHGTATGIDEDGALLLETPAGILRQVSGEVSVRRRSA